MSLKLWLESGWLKEHKPTSREIAELLAVADRALKDCQIPELSSEGKLNMAHNAALQSSAAALAAAGYRASREAYHYYVIQSLSFTLQLEESIIRRLHKLRRKRNISDYERAGRVTEQEAQDMVELAKLVRHQVEEWIRNNHKELAGEI
jgi:UDP-N-acetylenolpyruvoylglucosamine reductase